MKIKIALFVKILFFYILTSCSYDVKDVLGGYRNQYCEELILNSDMTYEYRSGGIVHFDKWSFNSKTNSILFSNWLEHDGDTIGAKNVTIRGGKLWFSADDYYRNFIRDENSDCW